MANKKNSVLPRLQADARLHGALSRPHRPDSAGLHVLEGERADVGPVLAHRHRAARDGVVSPEFRRVVSRGADQSVFRPARRLGAGALPVLGKRFVDALVDLPFALPTAVAGIA